MIELKITGDDTSLSSLLIMVAYLQKCANKGIVDSNIGELSKGINIQLKNDDDVYSDISRLKVYKMIGETPSIKLNMNNEN